MSFEKINFLILKFLNINQKYLLKIHTFIILKILNLY